MPRRTKSARSRQRSLAAACFPISPSPVIENLEPRYLLSLPSFAQSTIGLNLPAGVHTTSLIATYLTSGPGTSSNLNLVAANTNDTLSVLLGNGDGTFKTLAPIGDGLSGAGPAQVVSAQINGVTNLIVENGTDELSLLTCTGPGAITLQAPVALAHPVSTMTVADLNGDGTPDLAVGYDGGGVTIILGNPAGGFGTPSAPLAVTSGANVTTIVAINTRSNATNILAPTNNANHDGIVDLIVGESNKFIYELLGGAGNNGSATPTFQLPIQPFFNTQTTSFNIYPTETDGDGFPDLVLALKNGIIDEFIGNGDGTFKFETLTKVPQNIQGNVALADVNGDGNADLVVSDSYTNYTLIYLGLGDGAFLFPPVLKGVGNGPQQVVTADFTGDGKPDIITANYNTGVVTVLMNTTFIPGEALFNPVSSVAIGSNPQAIATFGGTMNLVVANTNANTVDLLLSNGNGTFSTLVAGDAGMGLTGPESVAVADVNGDGFPDIIVGNSNGTVVVLENNGNNTFAASTPIAVGGGAGKVSVAAGAFRGGATFDIVAVNSNSTQGLVLVSSGANAFTATPINVGSNPVDVVAGTIGPYVTHSTSPDIVVVNQSAATASIIFSNGNGTFFLDSNAVPVGPDPQTLTLADLNGDGIPDLIVTHDGATGTTNGATISTFIGNGTGEFQLPHVAVLPGTEAGNVVVDDFLAPLGILIQDVVVSSATPGSASGTVSVLIGNGDGTFLERFNYTVPTSGPSAVALGDFNGDGRPDIAATANYGNSVNLELSGNVAYFTSPSATTFTTGVFGSFTIATSGGANTFLTESGKIPSGMHLFVSQNGSLILYGTPAANAGGVYPMTYGSRVGIAPTTTQAFTLTVDQPTAFASAKATSFAVGVTNSFAVVATGFPVATVTESGALPAGVVPLISGSNGTALLTGTPTSTAGSPYPITFIATVNGAVAAIQTFTLTVVPGGISGPNNTAFTIGVPASFGITTSGFATTPTISESGVLPMGVVLRSVGAGAPELIGTPAAGTANTYPITLTASARGQPSYSQAFTLTVNQIPKITSATHVTFTAGTAGTFSVTSTGFPAPTISDGMPTLPAGVTFDTNTFQLAGTPMSGSGGKYVFTLTASNGVTTPMPVTQTFTLTVNEAPHITVIPLAFTSNNFSSFTIHTTGFPDALLAELGALPAGVHFKNNGDDTATISGTPVGNAGKTFSLLIGASNGLGSNRQTFTLTVS